MVDYLLMAAFLSCRWGAAIPNSSLMLADISAGQLELHEIWTQDEGEFKCEIIVLDIA